MNKLRENIYYEIMIIYMESSNDFSIVDTSKEFRQLFMGIKDLETAKKIKRAYCDGYYDGIHDFADE